MVGSSEGSRISSDINNKKVMEGLVSETKLLRHRVDGDVKIRKFRIKPVDKRQMSIAKGAFIFYKTGGGVSRRNSEEGH